MVSKRQNLDELEDKDQSLIEIINNSDAPKVRFMSDLTIPQLSQILNILNQDDCKIHIFKFLNDLSMIYGIGYDSSASTNSSCEVHGQYLSDEFFDQITLLRNSCNDFEGIQNKLSTIMMQESNQDLAELINMLEYMVPSHSLDMLALIIIAAGNTNEGYCAIAYGKVE